MLITLGLSTMRSVACGLLTVSMSMWAMLAAMLPACAPGEVIVDDFIDPFEIALPEMDELPIEQLGIGSLNATRRAEIVALTAEPTGSVDANISRISALTFDINEVNPTSNTLLPVIGFSLVYYIDETDITQGGANDRVVLDFAHLRSELPLSRINVFLLDASQSGASYVSQVFDLPPNESPFSLEFPFDTFGIRGGGASTRPDFTRTIRVSVTISPIRFIDIDQLNFSTVLERIRITHAVPEPASAFGIVLCVASTLFLWSWKKESRR